MEETLAGKYGKYFSLMSSLSNAAPVIDATNVFQEANYGTRKIMDEMIAENILPGTRLENVENLLKYFSQYETKEGYIYNLPGWNFVEWSDANLESHLEGINFPTNMLYSEALIMAGKLLDKQNLIQKGKKLKEWITNWVDNEIDMCKQDMDEYDEN